MTKSSPNPSNFQIRINSKQSRTFTWTAFLPALGLAEPPAAGAGAGAAAGGGAGALISRSFVSARFGAVGDDVFVAYRCTGG